MVKKLTITVSDEVYDGLYARVGPRRIGKFLEGLARSHVTGEPSESGVSLIDSYREIAKEEEAEAEARDWIETHVDECLPDDDFSDWPGYPSR